jgi:hypothetical protein
MKSVLLILPGHFLIQPLFQRFCRLGFGDVRIIGRKSLVFLAEREFLVLSRYMLRILIEQNNLEEGSSEKAGIMTATVSCFSSLPI